MEDRKVVGIKLTNQIEIEPINESDFDDVASKVMDKVIDDIFEMGHHCGCSEAKPVFENEKDCTLFKNIRRVLDDFEYAVKKDNDGKKLTKDEEASIMQSNFRLAEALVRDWCGAEKVATMVLTEREIVEKMEVGFDNNI